MTTSSLLRPVAPVIPLCRHSLDGRERAYVEAALNRGNTNLDKEEPFLIIIIRIAVVAVLSVLAISFFGFSGYDKPKDLTRIKTAIVFTGADERVRVGLELLKAGLVKRLYISGSNPNAGIWSLNYFEKKFGNGEGDMRPLLECCIQFGALAENTFQNALETRCWVKTGAEWPDPTDNVNPAYGKGENCIGTSIADGRDYVLSRSRRRRSSQHIGAASAKNHRLHKISRDRRTHGAAQLAHPPGTVWPLLQTLSRWRGKTGQFPGGVGHPIGCRDEKSARRVIEAWRIE